MRHLTNVVLLLSLCAFPGSAQVAVTGKPSFTGNVSIKLGAAGPAPATSTNTQSVITYTAPDTAACTFEVSESAAYTPPIHDMDTSLFGSDANSDARAGSLGSGTAGTRQFVVGKRVAEKASDGHWYSRAAQVNTLHYYRRTCSDGAHTGTFTTGNLMIGNTYWDGLPPDPNAGAKPYTSQLGFYAHPEFTKWDISDPTARQETVIDPKTGVLLKRMGMPRDQPLNYGPDGPQAFTTAAGSAWTNPSNVLTDDGNSATYSGSGSDFLFVSDTAFDNTALNQISGHPTDFLSLQIRAWCSVGACASADATIQACLTINGTSCWPTNATTKFQELILGTSANPAAVTLGTGCSVPILDCWTPAGYQPLTRVDLKSGGALGWLIRKKSASTDQINIQYIRYTQGTSLIFDWVASGSSNLSSPTLTQNSVTLGLGYHSVMKTNGLDMLYWTDHATGDSNYLGFFQVPGTNSSSADGFGGGGCVGARTLAGTTPTANETVYCSLNDNGIALATTLNGAVNNPTTTITVTDGSKIVNYREITLVAEGVNNSEIVLVTAGGGTNTLTVVRAQEGSSASAHANGASVYVPRTIIASCSLTSTNQTGSLSIACTNMTPASTGKDLSSLTASFTASDTPAFDYKLFGCALQGIQNGKLMVACQRSYQDTMAWNVVFDPTLVSSAAGCVGGGAAGCVTAAMSTWAHAPARWCVNHTSFVSGPTDIVWTAGKFFRESGIPGDGPYRSNITAGSLASATGAIAPGVGLCPAGTLRCDTVTVDGEPCDETPAAGEAAANACPKNASWVFLQNAAVGDIFQIDDDFQEWIVLANKSGNSWTFQRGYGFRGSTTHTGAFVAAFCSAQDFTQPYTNLSWTWDSAADPHGTNSGGATIKVAWDYDHVTPWTTQTIGGDAFWDPNCAGILSPCYGIRTTGAMGDGPNIWASAGPPFAGAVGTLNFVLAEDHPGWLQSAASTAEQKWLLDGRPLQPTQEVSDTATLVSGQLYKITSTTTDGDNLTHIGGAGSPNPTIGAINRKLLPTWGYCGTQPLIDISSAATGNQIGDTSADAFKYCLSRLAGECRTGSAQGDIYANCPNQALRPNATYGCSGQDQTLTNNICFGNSSAYLHGISQIGFGGGTDYTGAYGRTLTNGIAHYKLIDGYWNAQAFADASWAMTRAMYLGGAFTDAILIKLPPFPASDGKNRATFLSTPITLAAVGGATNGIVRFGYAENGAYDAFRCTSRLESCVANAATVQTVPFQYQLSDGAGAETGITGVACSSGCSIALPVIGGRTVYYQKVWRNSSGNATVQTGPIELAIVP